MKGAWKVIITIALIAALIGALCMGVGLLTGAKMDVIYQVLDDRYHVEVYYRYVLDVINAVAGWVRQIP